MCGRISQSQDGRIYMEAPKCYDRAAEDSDYAPGPARWNMPPGNPVRVIAASDGFAIVTAAADERLLDE